MTTTTPVPVKPGEGTGVHDPVRVVVLNDNHNTYEHVIETFMTVLRWDVERAFKAADRIHRRGRDVVFEGHRERAELIHQQLERAGLTMEKLS